MIFLSLFAVPLLIALASYVIFGSKISPKELALWLAIQAVFTLAAVGILRYRDAADIEVWNGRIAAKSRDVVSCAHAYPCNCHPVSCGKNCTSVHCDICHLHAYDVDWDVRTSNGEGVEIDRVSGDLQGTTEPPRWTSVKIGEPTSLTHSYQNYVKAAPDSIFRGQGEDPKEQTPGYPSGVYDYYRLDHLVQFGLSVPDAKEWNEGLAQIDADLGKAKQVNVVLVLAAGKPHSWFRVLERRWIGGKKNDAVVVVGTEGTTIQWAEVMAWTDHAYYKVKLRDELLAIGKLDRQKMLDAIAQTTAKEYVRKPMEDFAYLRASVTPTRGEFITAFVLSVLLSVGLAWFFEENDVFGDEDEEEEEIESFFSRILGRKPKQKRRENPWER
jgi:hypothetical protein